jgi:hypothetical protein
MRLSRFVLRNAYDSWMFWAMQELRGRDYAGKSKYQRERWHLKSLHDAPILDDLAWDLASRLGRRYGRADIRLGSIWVDQTPQAKARYLGIGKTRSGAVKCELADLVIVTMASFGGAPVRSEDIRAVLVQAKVTTTPGTLDADRPRTSSHKERNLLECCSSPIELFTGTGASTLIGNYDLGSKPASPGLARYSQYLTIPRTLGAIRTHPYQSLWPAARNMQYGPTRSLSNALYNMLDLPSCPEIGCALGGGGIPSDWPRLISDLTRLYNKSVVNRFTGHGAPAFPRVQASGLHSCFFESDPRRQRQRFVMGTNGLRWQDMSSFFPPHGGNGLNKHRAVQEFDDSPAIPILLIQASVGAEDRPLMNREE